MDEDNGLKYIVQAGFAIAETKKTVKIRGFPSADLLFF